MNILKVLAKDQCFKQDDHWDSTELIYDFRREYRNGKIVNVLSENSIFIDEKGKVITEDVFLSKVNENQYFGELQLNYGKHPIQQLLYTPIEYALVL